MIHGGLLLRYDANWSEQLQAETELHTVSAACVLYVHYTNSSLENLLVNALRGFAYAALLAPFPNSHATALR